MFETLALGRRGLRFSGSLPTAFVLLIAIGLLPSAPQAASFGVAYHGELTGIAQGCKALAGPCEPPDAFPPSVDTGGFLDGQSTLSTSLAGSSVGLVDNVPANCGPNCGVIFQVSRQEAHGAMSGTASIANLGGVADVSALAAQCCLGGAFGPPSPLLALARGTERMDWRDTLMVASGGLPAGTVVDVLVTLTLHSTIMHSDGPGRCQGGFASPATATATVNIGSTTTTVGHDFCAGGADVQTATSIVRTTVGAELSSMGSLELKAEAVAGQGINLLEHTTLDAGDTATTHLDPLTPDVFLTSASGHDYTTLSAEVPEPATILLLGCGVLGTRVVARLARRVKPTR